MKSGKIRALIIAFAFAGIPLVTTGTCNPRTGTFDFYRNTDDGEWYEEGVYIDDGWYYEDPYIFDDPYYYDDPYYHGDCFFCF